MGSNTDPIYPRHKSHQRGGGGGGGRQASYLVKPEKIADMSDNASEGDIASITSTLLAKLESVKVNTRVLIIVWVKLVLSNHI